MNKDMTIRKNRPKPIKFVGTRQVVEGAIDASKSSRKQSWDLAAKQARMRFSSQKACDQTEE